MKIRHMLLPGRCHNPLGSALSRLITPQIAVILVIAAALRLNHVTQPFIDAFSWRQASTAMMADNFYRTSWNILYPEVNWSGPGPSYQGRELQTVSYAAALLYTVLGQRDWIGRSVSIMFGLWGIYALYQLLRRVWGEKLATAGAAVMAVLPGSIFIERSFLPDPAMVALTVTSFWLLVLYLQTERWRYLVLAGLIGAWGFCTKIPGLIVGLPMAYAWLAILGWKRARKPQKLAALGAFALLTLVPVAAYYLWARHLALSYPPHHFAGAGNWIWNDGLGTWWSQGFFLTHLSQRFRDWLWTPPVIGLVAFALVTPHPLEKNGLLRNSAKEHQGSNCQTPWLFHFWLLAGLLYYLIGAKELVANPWNFHIISPAAAALAGRSIVLLATLATRAARGPILAHRTGWRSSIVPRLVSAAALLVIVVSGQRGLRWMYHPYAYESRELGRALRRASQPDDLVLTVANDLGDPIPIYYSQRRGWVFPPAQPDQAWNQLPKDDNETIQLFKDLRAQGADWLGIVHEQRDALWEDHPLWIEHVESTCQFHSESPEYVIYHIPSPEELARQTLSHTPTPMGDLDAPLVNQEIRYCLPEAGEVLLIWGINGWTVVPEAHRPPGTFITDGVMYTRMEHTGDAFIANVQVPQGATIDYVFKIAQTRGGTATEIWDANGEPKQDYHTVAGQGYAAEVQAPPSVVGYILARDTSALDIPWPALVFLAGVPIGLIVVGARTWFIRRGRWTHWRKWLSSSASRDISRVALVIITIAIIGVLTVDHYGLSTDEPTGFRGVWHTFELITEGKPLPSDLKYYGPIFDVTAEITFLVQEYLRYNLLHQDHSPDFPFPFDRMNAKHTQTFLFSLIAHISVAGLAGIYCGRKYAWLGPITLAFLPRFWGHSFFNFKDIPFAALFTLCAYAGAHLVVLYLREGQARIGANRVTAATILFGILVGLLTGIRVGGTAVIPFILITHILVSLGQGSSLRDLANLGTLYALMLVVWLATTVMVHPASWTDPLGWLFETVGYHSKHAWPRKVLLDGQYISAQALPWYYLPEWIVITLPLASQIFFFLGLVLIIARYPRFSDIQRATTILVSLQIFCLPIWAVIRRSTMYDGMRHFLFILPGIATLSSVSVVWLYERLPGKKMRRLAAVLMIAVFTQIGLDMLALHPYEYTYFNRMFGGLPNAYRRYETDYWGLSMREGMEWINEHGNSGTRVIVGGPIHSAKTFADPGLTVVELDYDLEEEMDISRPFYYLSIPKHGLQDVFPECQTAYQVLRQGAPLTIVKQCN